MACAKVFSWCFIIGLKVKKEVDTGLILQIIYIVDGCSLNQKKVGRVITSVIMPLYDAQKFLQQAIESILNQTHTDFELLIINDGSTDSSLEIIHHYAARDARIRVVSRENKGLIYSLNEGIGLAKGKYIARMDADDLCHPTRLEKQIALLEQHSDIGVVGTHANLVSNTHSRPWPFFNQHHHDIVALLPFHSPFIHPSVVFRRELLGEQPYNADYPHAEDFKLWTTLAGKTKFANIPEVLYDYRVHEASVSARHNHLQVANSLRTIHEYLVSRGVTVWNESLHRGMVTSFFQDNDMNLYGLLAYIDQLEQAMKDRAFTKRAHWIKSIFIVHHTKIPSLFVFHACIFQLPTLKLLTFRQFLSLIKRSFT